MSRTTVKMIQFIIISLVIYSSSIVPWSFSCHFCVIYCWPVCLHWSDKCSLILKLFLRFGCKVSVVYIQTGLTYFLSPQVCGRSCRGFQLGVQTFLLQLIDSLGLKYPSRSSLKPFFSILTCVYHIYWISIHWSLNLSSGVLEKCQWNVSKSDIQTFFPCRFVKCHGESAGCCDFTCSHQ